MQAFCVFHCHTPNQVVDSLTDNYICCVKSIEATWSNESCSRCKFARTIFMQEIKYQQYGIVLASHGSLWMYCTKYVYAKLRGTHKIVVTATTVSNVAVTGNRNWNLHFLKWCLSVCLSVSPYFLVHNPGRVKKLHFNFVDLKVS